MEESQKGQREARREMVDGAREGERREGAVLCSTVRREPVSRSLLNQRLAAGSASAGPVGGDNIA